MAFVGKLKSFEESFPEAGSEAPAIAGELSAENAKMLGALFRLKGRGVPMTVEKISLH